MLPECGGSPNANDIAELYTLILVIALVIFVGVEGALIWFLIRFKARRGRVAAQIHGNTRLEIGWTVGAAVILVFITVVTFAKLPGIKNPPPRTIDASGDQVAATHALRVDRPAGAAERRKLNIEVDGQQYMWQYVYPRGGRQGGLRLRGDGRPGGTTVTLDIAADDVVHSWWIPELGGKFDAVPGYHNYTWFKVDKPGVFHGQCAVLCGRGHARMVAASGPCRSTSSGLV